MAPFQVLGEDEYMDKLGKWVFRTGRREPSVAGLESILKAEDCSSHACRSICLRRRLFLEERNERHFSPKFKNRFRERGRLSFPAKARLRRGGGGRRL